MQGQIGAGAVILAVSERKQGPFNIFRIWACTSILGEGLSSLGPAPRAVAGPQWLGLSRAGEAKQPGQPSSGANGRGQPGADTYNLSLILLLLLLTLANYTLAWQDALLSLSLLPLPTASEDTMA